MSRPSQQLGITRHVVSTRPRLLTRSVRILRVLRPHVSTLCLGIRLAREVREIVLMVVGAVVLAPP